ncbi:unnamed protein product [Ectocarpus sp. 12 AP-2014]
MYEWEKAASMGFTTTATATSSGSSSHHSESAAAAASPWAASDGRQRHPPPLAAGSRNGVRQSSNSSVEAEASPAPSSTEQPSVGIRSSSGTSSGGGGGGGSTNGDSREKSMDGDLIGDETAALAARTREGSGVTVAAAAAAATENLSPPLPVAAPSEGVVIRVLISGAHASFLHMRVFPSTTAGQVCRKIGEKLRQLPAEQNDYVLIAIYARPAKNVSDAGHGSTGPSHRHSAGDADRGAAVGGDEVSNDGAGYTAGGGRDERERRHDGRRRRRGEEEHQSSIRHILHTFRSEERLGEVRLGLPEPNSAGRPQYPANSHDRGARGDADGPDRGRTDSLSTWATASSPAAGGAADIDAALRAQGIINNGGGGRRVDEEGTAGKLGVSRGNGGVRRGEGGEEGSGAGARGGRAEQAALMWRSRWIYRERTAPALDADELQVEVSGSDTSEDERRAGWIDLRGLGQGHYCGYLQKKSRSDPNLWRRRWCILADDRLWLLRSKSEQSGRRRGGGGRSHSFSLALVPCVARAVNRPTAPSHCFELHSQNRVHTFRAESRAKQVAWVGTLQRHARQAAEDSYMSVAEHMVCDEEYARCRRLNVTLSSALGSRACDTLEADFYSSHVADRPVGGRGSSGGGSVGGGWLPLPPPPPLPRTSGLFRRLPQGPPPPSNSTSAAASAVRAAPGLVSGSRSPLLPPPLPPPPPPLVRSADGGATASSARRAAGGGATIDSAERPWLAASEVRRAMRFCMKVHRYREICRPGSCVAFRKRWAYAADALEELCPGASTAAAADLSRHWSPPPPLAAVEAVSLPALGAGGESAADDVPYGRDESGIEAAGPRSGFDAPAAATANENRDEKNPSGKRSEAPATSPREDQRAAVVASGPSSTSAAASGEACSASLRTTAVLASPREVDGEGRPTTPSGLSPPPTAAAVSASTLPVAEAVALPTGDRTSPTLLTAAAAEATTTAAKELVPRPSQSSTHHHALLLAAACSQETVVGVARDLREYVEAVTRSRASRAAKGGGGGDGGAGGGGKSAGPGGALGTGAGAAGENGLQEPPAEGLFDALLDQVLQALGDA